MRDARFDPPSGDMTCPKQTAGHAAGLIADRFSFRLDAPIVVRQEMRENAMRVRFMTERARTVVPLAARDVEALRQLGYAE